jgi:imidazolonepropionase-like amidohydrolase
MGLTAIVGATVLDGTGGAPISDGVVVVEDERVRSVGTRADGVPDDATVVDAAGRWVIPGLMDANVHLYAGTTADLLLEFEGHYDDQVTEAAQIALRSGVTTVFDTWGPLRPLVDVRDRINRGELTGSRIFAAGNIIGFGGPMSDDFFPAGNVFGTDVVERINAQWEQGTGPDLLWLTPEELRSRVREYIERSGIDFIKYAASGHKEMQFITFSEPAQQAIVEEGHRAGLTVQAHSTSPESLRMEIEAGADLLQHGDVTGKEPMPEATMKTIVEQGIPVAALICTDAYMTWVREDGPELLRLVHETKDENDRRLIDAGARLLLTTDAFAFGPRMLSHPRMKHHAGVVDSPVQIGDSHFLWLQGAIERGMAPMEALLSGTRYIAEAYKHDDLGSLEPGKRADLVVLDADPLADVRNYRRIAEVMKDGVLVDRAALPERRVLTEGEG